MENRLIGREVTLRITRGGKMLSEITAFQSFTWQYDIEEKNEGYLGEDSDRPDSIYKMASGSFEIVPESPDVIDLQKFIADKAARRLANDEQISATCRSVFPDKRTRRVTFPDMQFGNLPTNTGGRADYVKSTFAWRCRRPTVSP